LNSASNSRWLLHSLAPPSDSSPACAFDLSSSSTFVPLVDLRLRSTLRLCHPACFWLAPPAHLPALPLNPTSDSHRLSHSPAAFDRSVACAAIDYWPAFRLISDLRLRPAFRLPFS
jgi:hypothetical protein